MKYRGIEKTREFDGLTDDQFRRLLDLDRREVDGKLTKAEEQELDRLIRIWRAGGKT